MKKLSLIAVFLLAIGVCIAVYLRPETTVSNHAPAAAVSPETKKPPSFGRQPSPRPPITKTKKPVNEEPPESLQPQPIGQKRYDTGITKYHPVRKSADGKNLHLEARQLANQLHSAELSPEQDLEILDQLLGFYRLSFESNPVAGDNQMVIEALRGDNPRNLVLFPANHPSIDTSGQLLDRWGTPYFFHALSGEEMEIFSAGPDGRLHTSDDVQITHRTGQPLTGRLDSEPETEPAP